MYLPNKYSRWYYQIIDRAKSREKIEGYFEKHHIIPKSLGGSNSTENLVRLTAREHFICHWLLTRMISGLNLIKMKRAMWRMLMVGADFQKRYIPNSKTYEVLRLQYGSLRKGVVTSLETKQKISIANTGNIAWNKGIARTDEEKIKLSTAAKNRKRLECRHCKTLVTPGNYKRWHSDNCKVVKGELKFRV